MLGRQQFILISGFLPTHLIKEDPEDLEDIEELEDDGRTLFFLLSLKIIKKKTKEEKIAALNKYVN